jgi:hypothetical protein
MARHSFPGRCLKAALDVTSLAGGDRLRLCQFRRRRSVRTSGATATQNWRPRAGLSTRPAVSRRALLAPTHAGRDCTAPASDLSLQCTAAAMAGEHAPLSAGFEPHPPALVPPRLPLERPIHLLGPAPPRPAPPIASAQADRERVRVRRSTRAGSTCFTLARRSTSPCGSASPSCTPSPSARSPAAPRGDSPRMLRLAPATPGPTGARGAGHRVRQRGGLVVHGRAPALHRRADHDRVPTARPPGR